MNNEKERKRFKDLSPEVQVETVSAYMQETSQKTAIEDLLHQIETAQQGYLPTWPTGFPALDKKLDGGFLGGTLILMGAISSLGKTTFALQMAENMACAGKDVLVFSLEMSKNELNAKSISRNTFNLTDDKKDPRKKYRLTTSDILRGRIGGKGCEQRKLFDEALEESQKANDHIFIIRDNKITVDDVGEIIETHIAARNSTRPFVIIDYLQILKPSETSKSGDKRLLTDEDVNNLKDIAVRLDVPIMVISSFNRASYFDPVSMGSFKESGSIEYSSDVLIGLQYTGMEYLRNRYYTDDSKIKRIGYETKESHNNRVRDLISNMEVDGSHGNFLPIDLVILKNRSGSKGTVLFEFCPKYNVYRELYEKDGVIIDLSEPEEAADDKKATTYREMGALSSV